ncbi:MAG: FHA domain-containing protein [Planctomycetota bacterium]
MEEQLEELRRAVLAAPGDEAARLSLALALRRAGQEHGAWEALQAGLALEPEALGLLAAREDLLVAAGAPYTLRVLHLHGVLDVRLAEPARLRGEETAYASLGRDPAGELVLRAPSVARRHCGIRHEGGVRFTLHDHHTANGTYVAGRRIDQHTLRDGDVFEVGGCRIEFRFGWGDAGLGCRAPRSALPEE